MQDFLISTGDNNQNLTKQIRKNRTSYYFHILGFLNPPLIIELKN